MRCWASPRGRAAAWTAAGGGGPDGAKDVYGALRLYRTAVSRSAEEPERFAEASERMDELDGWKALARLDEVATSLRVKHLEGQTLATLSGGGEEEGGPGRGPGAGARGAPPR